MHHWKIIEKKIIIINIYIYIIYNFQNNFQKHCPAGGKNEISEIAWGMLIKIMRHISIKCFNDKIIKIVTLKVLIKIYFLLRIIKLSTAKIIIYKVLPLGQNF